jgi:hypothetical protein
MITIVCAYYGPSKLRYINLKAKNNNDPFFVITVTEFPRERINTFHGYSLIYVNPSEMW